MPGLVLWAWESPQDLRFLDPDRAGVAYLAATLTLHADTVWIRPRMQPLLLGPRTPRLAVVRIQSDPGSRPRLSARQAQLVSSAIRRAADAACLTGVQIDFDAGRSQRKFYRALLMDVRRVLPDSLGLSMTALASWGLFDRWLGGLAVEEAVPMAFRMGADDARVRAALAGGVDFAPALCRTSIGVSLDEPLPRIPRGRRVYLFHSGSWTRKLFEAAVARLRRRM